MCGNCSLVRELLEVAAAGWCAVNASDAEIRAMREMIEIESRQLDDASTLIDINRRLHQEICNGAHNGFLRKALATVQSSFALLGKSNLLSRQRAEASHQQHLAILAAIEQRDRVGAEQAARMHVQTSLAERLRELGAAAPGVTPPTPERRLPRPTLRRAPA